MYIDILSTFKIASNLIYRTVNLSLFYMGTRVASYVEGRGYIMGA